MPWYVWFIIAFQFINTSFILFYLENKFKNKK